MEFCFSIFNDVDLKSAFREKLTRVADTEIDWKTYMEQASVFIRGETDYTKIEGPTGPCVYPAMHVYIYSALHELTDAGKNILTGQKVFYGLFLTTLFYVLKCYRAVQVSAGLNKSEMY